MAHRTSWLLTYGKIPEGLCVLHKCDNPPCVNPDHLFIGTKADNFLDMVSKKRNSHGERHYKAIITDAAVRRIRKMYDSGIGPAAIALTMGIEMKHASLIGRRKRWKHVK